MNKKDIKLEVSISDPTVDRIIEEMTKCLQGEEAAIVTINGEQFLFLSQSFLDKFVEEDGVNVNDAALHASWGYRVRVSLTGPIIGLYSTAGKEVPGWRFRKIWTSEKDVLGDIERARQYKRIASFTIEAI